MEPSLAFARRPHPLRLECGVQHYDWGQRGAGAYIPSLLGVPAEEAKPYAELWIGAHPVRPAQARVGEERVPLTELIASAPTVVLGPEGVRRYGARLPFLLKVLAAEKMLSIQAHPDRRQAAAGFAREEAAGIPRDAEHRNYRDDNHKPELIVALTDFHALCGFRPLDETLAVLGRYEALAPLLTAAGSDVTVESLFTLGLSWPADAIDATLGTLVSQLEAADRARPFTRHEVEYWLIRADRQFSRGGHRDRGLLAMLMLNLVSLAPGEALFLGAGDLHSYLEGVGVELMASSDNVLRGGLTSKHVDGQELRNVLTFRAGPASVIRPTPAGVYETPAEEFELSAITVGPNASWTRPPRAESAPDVLLVTAGAAVLDVAGEPMRIARGACVLVPATLGPYQIRATEPARVFRATVPPWSLS